MAERPYLDDPLRLVKTQRRLTVLRLAARDVVFLVPGIPTYLGSAFYGTVGGEVAFLDSDLLGPLYELYYHQFLCRVDGGPLELAQQQASLFITAKGADALARWEKSEKKRQGDRS